MAVQPPVVHRILPPSGPDPLCLTVSWPLNFFWRRPLIMNVVVVILSWTCQRDLRGSCERKTFGCLHIGARWKVVNFFACEFRTVIVLRGCQFNKSDLLTSSRDSFCLLLGIFIIIICNIVLSVIQHVQRFRCEASWLSLLDAVRTSTQYLKLVEDVSCDRPFASRRSPQPVECAVDIIDGWT